MKKFLAIMAAIMLLAPAAYALDSMDDGTMDAVTGQAGLSITNFVGGMTITTTLGGLSWGDDDGYAPLGAGTAAAGHVTIDALGAVATLGVTITQPSGNVITIDVDDSGIYMGMGSVAVSVTPPTYLKISVESGNTEAFDLAASVDTLGDLGFEALAIAVTTPTVMQIAPH